MSKLTHRQPEFFERVTDLLKKARNSVVKSVNQAMVRTYFEIGRMIIEEEQGGSESAKYGKHIIQEFSQRLTKEFGKGFSQRKLEQMRQFYIVCHKTPSSL